MRDSLRKHKYQLRNIMVAVASGLLLWVVNAVVLVGVFHRGTVEERIFHPDAYSIFTLLIIILAFTAYGILSYCGIAKRRLLEDSLEESEEKYRNLFEKTSNAVIIYDAETMRFEDINSACLNLYGYTKEEFLLLTPKDISAEPEKAERGVKDVIAGEPEAGHVPLRYHKKKDGTVFPVEIFAGTFIHKGNEKIFQTVIDLTESENMKDALRTAKKEWELTFDAISDPLFVHDSELNIVRANKAYQEASGLPFSELIGKPYYEVFPKMESPFNGCLKALKSREVEKEIEVLTPIGKIYKLRFYPIKMLMADKKYSIHILEDITENKRAEENLRKSEKKYRDLTESTSDWVWELDENGIYTYASSRVKDLLGYEPREIIGKSPFDLMHQEEARRVAEEFSAIAKAKRPFAGLENTNLHKDGRLVVLETSGVPIFDAEGNFKGYRGIDRDITERRRAEETLKESEKRYKRLIEANTDYIFTVEVKNDQPVKTTHGPACVKITGYTSEEYEKNPKLWIQMVQEGDRDAVIRQAEAVFSGKAKPLEHRIITKEGRIKWVSNIPVPRYDGKGRLISYDGLISDITERRKAEEFIKDILQSVGEGFLVINTEYKIMSANRSYLEQEKADIEDVLGRHCYDVSHHRDNPCFMEGEECAPKHTFETGAPYTAMHTHYDKDGNPIYIETKSFPMKDMSGKFYAVIETLDNITEKRTLEGQLRHAQKMEAVGTLAGGVAHDFNNILSAIIGYAHISLMKMKPDDPVRYNIDQILACSQRATALTQGLLSFSRKQVINPVLLDLNELLRRFEKFILRLIREDIEFTCRYGAGALTVMADSGQIEQAIMNLVTNARDAMPAGGRLMIEANLVRLDKDFVNAHGYGVLGEFALISISDTGIGMDETTKARIFEPFFTTKEQGKGTGLGLSIVYGIIKKHDGFITVYSEPGKGTTFRIYLPVSQAKAAPEETHTEEPVPSLEGTETILLAEDDEAVRRLTRTVLENFGYTVIETIDGEDAVLKFIANKDRVQLAILDAIMPKKNGGEVFREIKALKPNFPVLFMSGYPGEIVGKQGLLDPGINFVPKPISPSDLLKKVREMLGKRV